MVSHAYITTSGTWQAPDLVSGVILLGAGGGGGGGCANDDFLAGGGGGGGSIQQIAFIEVSPLTTYTITVGAGGAGGFPSANQLTYCGSDGYSTIFAAGASTLYTSMGAGGAGTNAGMGGEFNHGGLPWSGAIGNYILENTNASPIIIGAGGAWVAANVAFNGMRNFDGKYPGGMPNVDILTYGAGGGGAGPQGSGGSGGSLASPNGGNVGDNTGAGGGGGNIGSTMGGHGGSGYLHIIW